MMKEKLYILSEKGVTFGADSDIVVSLRANTPNEALELMQKVLVPPKK